MSFTVLDEGFITRRPDSGPTAVAGASRCAVTDAGEVVCTYAVNEALGRNNFKPVQSRSRDGGKTWTEEGMIWPHLHERHSIVGQVSRGLDGELLYYGIRIPIDDPGESFWSDATQGIKQNELIWASSADGGQFWSEPTLIPMPIPGSAEAPGPMCVTRSGVWVSCYAPYNTFDPAVEVDRHQVVFLRSEDRGQSWISGSMLRFVEEDSSGAEAWIVELADGRLLGTGWRRTNWCGGQRCGPRAILRATTRSGRTFLLGNLRSLSCRTRFCW